MRIGRWLGVCCAEALNLRMNSSPALPCLGRIFGFVFLGAMTASQALAHPGHDGEHGGGLTWDFIGEVLHRLSSPYHLGPAVVVGVIALVVWRKVRAKRERDSGE
jgi:hydrogenase/urease accessory protein HupE